MDNIDTINISGTSYEVDENGNIDFTDREGRTSHIGKISQTLGAGGRATRGRIFGTYITAEASSAKIVAAMLVAGYVASIQIIEPGELPF